MVNRAELKVRERLSLLLDATQILAGIATICTFIYLVVDRQKIGSNNNLLKADGNVSFDWTVGIGILAVAYFIFITVWKMRKLQRHVLYQSEQIILLKACVSGYLENARRTRVENNFGGNPSTINDADRFYLTVEKEIKQKWQEAMLTPEIEKKIGAFFQEIAV